jgi:hypothetical protein
MSSRVLWAGVAALICVGCHREAPAPQVDAEVACGSPGALARLKELLLPTAHGGREYLERVRQVHIMLSDVTLTGYDQESRAARCQATAHLVSPLVRNDPLATQQISYSSRTQAAGAAQVSSLQVPQGGDLDQFARLLKPVGVSNPLVTSAKAASHTAADADTAAVSASEPIVSPADETQRLIDQAGDTRAPVNETGTDTNSEGPYSAR